MLKWIHRKMASYCYSKEYDYDKKSGMYLKTNVRKSYLYLAKCYYYRSKRLYHQSKA